jgi:hypothetical protein
MYRPAAAIAAALTLSMSVAPPAARTTSGVVSGVAGRNAAITVFKGAVSAESGLTMEVGDRFHPMPVAATPTRLEFFRRWLSRSSD